MNDEEIKDYYSNPMRRLENNHYALGKAYQRLKKAIDLNHDEEIYSATGEMLLWVMTTNEWHLKHNKEYRHNRNNSDSGRILFGLLHAYNSMKHNMIFVKIHEKEGGFTLPISFPLSAPPITVHWISAEKVNEGYENQVDNYKKYVEGREILETFEQALSFLNEIKGNSFN